MSTDMLRQIETASISIERLPGSLQCSKGKTVISLFICLKYGSVRHTMLIFYNSSEVLERHSHSRWMQSTRIDSPFSARSTVESEIAAKSASCRCVHPRRSLSVRRSLFVMLARLQRLCSRLFLFG